MRRTRHQLVGFLVVLALLVSGAVLDGRVGGDEERAQAVGASPVAQLAGISTGGSMIWESDADLARDLDTVAATGAKWIRIDVDWSSIQYEGPTTWRWDRATDRVVTMARQRGLSILGILAYSPPWARGADCPSGSNKCLPADVSTFGTFANRAAQRYGSRSTVAGMQGAVTAWEIWNEPNHYPFARPKPDLDRYTAMLRMAYLQIKAADPNATVVTGGTSPAPDAADGTDISPVTWVKGLYARGARGYFDAVGHHPYSYPYSPIGGQSWNAFTQTKYLYDVMAQNGDGAKKVWGTEYGAPTGADPGRSVSEAVQAQTVLDAYSGWTKTYGAFTGPLFWHQHRDNGSNISYYDDNFGLLRRDWSAKPSFSTFQQMTAGGATLPPAPPPPPPPASASPIGALDTVGQLPGGVRLTGWTLDPDTTSSIQVHVWMDGASMLGATTANVNRPDIGAAFPAYGAAHGFDVTVAAPPGVHTLCAFAINDATGINPPLGCRRLNVATEPFGSFDWVRNVPGGMQVGGWAIDPQTSNPIDVHIWMDGAQLLGVLPANGSRPDVGAVYGAYGANHGFSGTVDVPPGLHTLCAFGINVGGGVNPLLGCRTVLDTGEPIGNIDWITPVPGGLRIAGWALDPDVATPIDVHLWMDGRALLGVTTANGTRTDVGNAFPGYGANHGYSTVVDVPAGVHTICAFGINVGGGVNPLLACRVVNVSSDPIGALEAATRLPDGRVQVGGWALDPDTADPITVHLWLDGRAFLAATTADDARPDIAAAFSGWGSAHGYSLAVDVPPGPHMVCAYGINVGGGVNPLLGCRWVS